MKTKLQLILILSIILSSCTKVQNDDKTVHVDTPLVLIGNWTWVFSGGGYTGAIYTPQTTGERKVISFDGDNNFKEFVNDNLNAECKFHIIKSISIFDHDSTLIILKKVNPSNVSFKIKSDTLTLYEQAYDGFEHQYTRVK